MPFSKVKFSDITFVVQGPVTYSNNLDVTIICLKSIQKKFPGSPIIFSTWDNQNLNSDYDPFKIIRNADPGSGFKDKNKTVLNNINRQIVSSLNGINQVETEYAVKVRSDIYFESNKILNYLNKYNCYDEDSHFLSNRVVVTNVTSINPRKKQKLPFHPCDWLYLGLKVDLTEIFSIPMFDEPQFSEWFLSRPVPSTSPFNDISARYAAESYIWFKFLKKFIKLDFDHLSDITKRNIELTERSFANNLTIVHPEKLGIRNLKTDLGLGYFQYCYSTDDWKRLYNKYANGDAIVPFFDIEKIKTIIFLIKRRVNAS